MMTMTAMMTATMKMTSRSDLLDELCRLPASTLTRKGMLAGACAAYVEGLPADARAAFWAWLEDSADPTWLALLRELLKTKEALPDSVMFALNAYCREAWSAAQALAAEVESEDDGTNAES
jgi:hypothetical protein